MPGWPERKIRVSLSLPEALSALAEAGVGGAWSAPMTKFGRHVLISHMYQATASSTGLGEGPVIGEDGPVGHEDLMQGPNRPADPNRSAIEVRQHKPSSGEVEADESTLPDFPAVVTDCPPGLLMVYAVERTGTEDFVETWWRPHEARTTPRVPTAMRYPLLRLALLAAAGLLISPWETPAPPLRRSRPPSRAGPWMTAGAGRDRSVGVVRRPAPDPTAWARASPGS